MTRLRLYIWFLNTRPGTKLHLCKDRAGQPFISGKLYQWTIYRAASAPGTKYMLRALKIVASGAKIEWKRRMDAGCKALNILVGDGMPLKDAALLVCATLDGGEDPIAMAHKVNNFKAVHGG